MSRVASPIGMIARKAVQVVAEATMPNRLTKRERDWNATFRDKTLRAACFIAELAHGTTVHYVPRLALLPAKPLSRPCRITQVLLQGG